MKHYPLFLLFLVVAIACSSADDEPFDLYEYEGSLEIDIPYKKILGGEIVHVNIRIDNGGEEPITVITDGQNDGAQLVWVPWENGAPKEGPGWTDLKQFKVSPLETLSETNLTAHKREDLAPGGRRELSHIGVRSLSLAFLFGGDERQLRPAIYVGKGRVIYGDPFLIKRIPKNVKMFSKVFETEFTSGGTSPIPFEVYEVPIDGETYLFGSTGVRFCRVPPEVGYSISFVQEEQPREYIMTVDFDDPTLDPLIFSWRKYNLVSASRETVPWLFDKPEEDAPEKGSGGENAAVEGGGAHQSEPLGQGTRPADGGEPPGAPAWWPWIGAAAVFFVTALWAIRRRLT